MTRRLLQRRRRLLSNLPPFENVLRGSVVERSVRCGRAGCHCEHTGGHQVAYLSVTLAAGRTEQISLPPAMLPAARRGVAAYHKWLERLDQISTINRQLLRYQRDARRTPAGRGKQRRRRG